jgi:hypothetical protein
MIPRPGRRRKPGDREDGGHPPGAEPR